MTTANGTLTPPSLPPAPTSPSVAKRKLAGSHGIVPNGASVAAQSETAERNTYSLQAVLGDMLEILKRYEMCQRCLHSLG